MSEATALPTEPQPLPTYHKFNLLTDGVNFFTSKRSKDGSLDNLSFDEGRDFELRRLGLSLKLKRAIQAFNLNFNDLAPTKHLVTGGFLAESNACVQASCT